ncbi:MAG: cysteine--tRNA ligase [Methanothrix sp.]|nr:cysteine--tRNA ligase [Methanothrix sp.]
MGLRVYNTLTRSKEDFMPRDEGQVSIYVCGVTPYDETHIGHARPSVVWDVIRKYLRKKGYKVVYVQNFTDVDDKIIARSAQLGISTGELSSKYIQDYLDAMEALGVAPADHYPKVSQHIDAIVAMVEHLIEQGFAYVVDGDVYFHVPAFSEYGKLSKQQLDELESGARIDVSADKRNPLDFALWKKSSPDEPGWDSPWGYGRPGWHIECSAMSLKYLGAGFDFHGGGMDLVFPHHENEIAQSESHTGCTFARYWLHNGLVTVNDEKMSKSLGIFLTVSTLLAKYHRELLRFYILSTHYRSPLEFNEEKIEEAKKGWQRLSETYQRLASRYGGEEAKEPLPWAQEAFTEAMDDDFNTARAMAVCFDVVRYANGPDCTEEAAAGAYAFLAEVAEGILGVVSTDSQPMIDSGLSAELVELLLAVREQLRQEKNWRLSDLIRDELAKLGIIVEDTKEGSRWKMN